MILDSSLLDDYIVMSHCSSAGPWSARRVPSFPNSWQQQLVHIFSGARLSDRAISIISIISIMISSSMIDMMFMSIITVSSISNMICIRSWQMATCAYLSWRPP